MPPSFRTLVKRLSSVLRVHITEYPHLVFVRVQGETSFDMQDSWIVSDLQGHRRADYRGIKIRSYVDQEGHELIHTMTSRTLEGEADPGREAVALWRGSMIPTTVLNAVYAVEGIDIEAEGWHRSMALGDRGWAILRAWEMKSY